MKNYLILITVLVLSCNSSTKNKVTTIDEYIDNKKTISFHYNDKDLLEKQLIYNTDTNTVETELEYRYKESTFDTLIVKKGIDAEYMHLHDEDVNAYEYISSKGIRFVYPDLLSNEIRDISNVLSVGENYSDFKIDTVLNGNKKTISFLNFNKKIRFSPSEISGFLPENKEIKEYHYILNKDRIEHEKFITEEGTLNREYVYDTKKIVKVVYKYNSKEHGLISFEKRFEYSK